MPHFGLMDADALGPPEAALQRARLHLRAGKRRLAEGKVSAGLVTLYDALECALEWHTSSPSRRALSGIGDDSARDTSFVLKALSRAGIIDSPFDFEDFNALVEKALREDIEGLDCTGIVAGLETVMTCIGVMPFDESALPPEQPGTF